MKFVVLLIVAAHGLVMLLRGLLARARGYHTFSIWYGLLLRGRSVGARTLVVVGGAVVAASTVAFFVSIAAPEWGEMLLYPVLVVYLLVHVLLLFTASRALPRRASTQLPRAAAIFGPRTEARQSARERARARRAAIAERTRAP